MEFEVIPFFTIAKKFIVEFVKSQGVAHSDKELHYDQQRLNRFLPSGLSFVPFAHLNNVEVAVRNKKDEPDY